MFADLLDKTAHHELGHAVAAVLRGGHLVLVEVDPEEGTGLTRWEPAPGDTKSTAFVAWAGGYAEHMWLLDNDADYAESAEGDPATAVRELLDGIDLEQYDGAVDELEEVAERLGLTPLSESWCRAWALELDDFYPAVEALAARMWAGETVTHEAVAEVIEARQREMDED